MKWKQTHRHSEQICVPGGGGVVSEGLGVWD